MLILNILLTDNIITFILLRNHIPVSWPLYPCACSKTSERRVIRCPHWPEFWFFPIHQFHIMNLESWALSRIESWHHSFHNLHQILAGRKIYYGSYSPRSSPDLGSNCPSHLPSPTPPVHPPALSLCLSPAIFLILVCTLSFGDLGLWIAVPKVCVCVLAFISALLPGEQFITYIYQHMEGSIDQIGIRT